MGGRLVSDYSGWEVVNEPSTNSAKYNGWQVVHDDQQKSGSTFPFTMNFQSPDQRQQTAQSYVDAAKGAAQSLLNTPEQAASVVGYQPYKPFNFAPNNTASSVGGALGDAASFFMPTGALSAAGKGLSLIPKGEEAINAMREFLQARPFTNQLTKFGGNASQAGLFEKEKNPNASNKDIGESMLIGGALPLASDAFFSTNPLVSAMAKTGIGGALGYHFGGIPGVAEGIGAAFTVPSLAKEAFMSRSPISNDMLPETASSANALERARSKYEAGQRIGDVPTPAEAFNSPILGAQQGEIGRTTTGAQAMADYGVQRKEAQQNAIGRFLDQIYQKTPANQNKINELYDSARSKSVTENALYHLMEDPVIRNASINVQSQPIYQKELALHLPSSVGYLDVLKRSLDDQQGNALRAGENDKARIIGDSINRLKDVADNAAPEYQAARSLAQQQIVRRQIEQRLGKKNEVTGKNFYGEFLSNPNKYNDLMQDMSNMPEAQATLKDMKQAWDGLIGYDTAPSAAGMAQRHTSSARNDFQHFWNQFKNSFGAPRDIEKANFIHDPDWWSKFDEAMQYRDSQVRKEKLMNLISKGVSAGMLESSKKTK